MLRRYARLIVFGNGGHHALYDKTDGFYRRQLILTTKDKVVVGKMTLILLINLGKKGMGFSLGT